MPRKNKKHHKVPATYLHGFTDNKSMLWVADRDFKLYSIRPENVLTENDFYTIKFSHSGGTLSIETKFLNGIESTYAKIFKDKLSKKFQLTMEEKAAMAIFIASLYDRVSNRRLSLQKFFDDIKEKTEHMRALPESAKKAFAALPMSSADNGIPADELLAIGEDVNSFHSSEIPYTVSFIAPIIFDMNWIFLVNTDKNNTFLTSDDPCTMVNPSLEKHYGRGAFWASPGLSQKDVEITLPISSDLALLCGWNLDTDLEYLDVIERSLHDINARTMRGAKAVISNNKEQLENLIKTTKERHNRKEQKDKL